LTRGTHRRGPKEPLKSTEYLAQRMKSTPQSGVCHECYSTANHEGLRSSATSAQCTSQGPSSVDPNCPGSLVQVLRTGRPLRRGRARRRAARAGTRATCSRTQVSDREPRRDTDPRLWMRSSQIGIPWRGVRGPKRESRETGGVAEGVNPRLVSS
jgi:hypothetical protein